MRRLIILVCMATGFRAATQNLSYIHYTLRDGLPGSVVYHCLQDNCGYIWFATNQGVSRFDGKTFRNFSKEDGLPDNDIMKLYLDKYNNIWFISFMGIPSVYHNGVISCFNNCRGVTSITEDLLTDSILLTANFTKGTDECLGCYGTANRPGHWQFGFKGRLGQEGIFTLPSLQVSTEKKINFYFLQPNRDTCSVLMKEGKTTIQYDFRNTWYAGYFQFKLKRLVQPTPDGSAIVFYAGAILRAGRAGLSCILSPRELHVEYNDLNGLYCENDSILWICTRNQGLVRVKNYLSAEKTMQSFFPKAFCTSILKDREGGYWVTTQDQGVFYLPNLDSYYLSGPEGQWVKDVKCIRVVDGHRLFAGFTDGNILAMDYRTITGNMLPYWAGFNKNNRILDLRMYGYDKILVASDYGLNSISLDNYTNKKIMIQGGIKCVYIANDSTIVFGNSLGLCYVNPYSEYNDKDFDEGMYRNDAGTYIQHRITCMEIMNHNYYGGTLNGVYEYDTGTGLVKNLGQVYPALGGVINHIDAGPDSALWVSTQQGVVVLKNGRATPIRKEQGLLNDMCKHVLLNDNIAWVSTGSGISRIVYHWENNAPVYSISNITESDGLISPDVSQTAIGGNNIWAATEGGICFFPKDYAPRSMQAPLININTIVRGNNESVSGDTVALDYKQNKLLIGLSGISFRSGRQIRYQYRLKDLDSNWTNTSTNLLEFSTLPFGSHTFEVRVIDRWGVKSRNVRRLTIVVRPPFWKAPWFTFLTYLFTAIVIGWGAYYYSRWQQGNKHKEYQLNKRMAELEMMALRAQMNPHFVFNCLSSIQYYVVRADVVNANLFLHKFSTLIRKILQYSMTSDITLEEELKILELYLELEKLRLGDRLEYSIRVGDDLRRPDITIPCMIIQPYVENAVRHGVSPLLNRKGMIKVEFSRQGDNLLCIIDDNGIGIAASVEAQQTELPGYRSLGRGITESRINIINTINRGKMVLEILDKKENGMDEHGTIVRLNFPI